MARTGKRSRLDPECRVVSTVDEEESRVVREGKEIKEISEFSETNTTNTPSQKLELQGEDMYDAELGELDSLVATGESSLVNRAGEVSATSETSSETATVSTPSQKIESQEKEELENYLEEEEWDGVITIKESEYQDLLNKTSKVCSFKEDVEMVREYFSNTLKSVEMDATKFEDICQRLGVRNLLVTLYHAMCTERMSEGRKTLNRIRAMIIIDMMMYGQSQKANYFQVSLSRTLQEFGINEQGLASLKIWELQHTLELCEQPQKQLPFPI